MKKGYHVYFPDITYYVTSLDVTFHADISYLFISSSPSKASNSPPLGFPTLFPVVAPSPALMMSSCGSNRDINDPTMLYVMSAFDQVLLSNGQHSSARPSQCHIPQLLYQMIHHKMIATFPLPYVGQTLLYTISYCQCYPMPVIILHNVPLSYPFLPSFYPIHILKLFKYLHGNNYGS